MINTSDFGQCLTEEKMSLIATSQETTLRSNGEQARCICTRFSSLHCRVLCNILVTFSARKPLDAVEDGRGPLSVTMSLLLLRSL